MATPQEPQARAKLAAYRYQLSIVVTRSLLIGYLCDRGNAAMHIALRRLFHKAFAVFVR